MQYKQKIGANGLSTLLQTAQKEEREALQEMSKRLKSPVDETMVRVALASLVDPDKIGQSYSSAIEAKARTGERLAAKKDEIVGAKQAFHNAEQECVKLRIPKGEHDEDIPDDEDECAHLCQPLSGGHSSRLRRGIPLAQKNGE